ncbi:MAG TPA: [protein-PII] uridylyltransferase [Desulfobacteraceae bacterium]|nr:[protein-PII] uridylyltransferase [Desulfobacteraceae bacterium]
MISPFKELKESKEQLLSGFSNATGLENFQENYTEVTDEYFRRMLQESEIGHRLFREKRPFAFVAVGGYGRRELCLHSDIDIIILFGSKIPAKAKELSDEIFFPLWDLGLDLGYGIRTINDCLTLSKNKFEVLTSMMDSRFICGDSPLFLSLTEGLHKKVIAKKTIAFGRWLEDLDKIRMDNFGDASYLLEPHLKEGIGGLRDYHHMLWLAKAFFHSGIPRDLEYMGKLSHNEYRQLEDNLTFIRLVRNHLHHLSGRRNDRLNFEYQEKIARILGFQDKKGVMAVENFLGRLHACMSSVKDIHRSFVITYIPKKLKQKQRFQTLDISMGLHVDQNEMSFDSSTAILSTPFLLMEIFEQSSILDCPLSMEARRLVREFIYLVDDTFRASHEAIQEFLDIMRGKNSVQALDEMFETGFLDAFIPEFGKIKDRVQFDAYHIFPVGRHSLETVKQLKNLHNKKELILLDIFLDLPNPEPLFLAALFHDVGKTGKDHARKGVHIARNILERFGYDKTEAKDILFLIRHHLLLAETATRRDLNDEKVVVQCARTIRDVNRLNMLYLLTWADSRATGPRAWNEWTASLVQELFFKILHILEKGELATPGASRKANKTRTKVRREMADKMNGEELENFFDIMSPRYLLSIMPRYIVRHLTMFQSFKEEHKAHQSTTLSIEAKEDKSEGCWELTFLVKDKPGLFSELAGALALNNINILSAQIYTWRDGTAVDIFKVTHPLDAINPDETWKKVERDLKHSFSGKLSLEYRLGQKAAPSILSEVKKPEHPPQVLVSNETSDFFTLIEVFADDRVGLLYLITRCLLDHRLDIRIAKIATKGDQVADVFYVRDLEGQKVEDRERLLEIERSLIHRLT